jgi:hypothetical protein
LCWVCSGWDVWAIESLTNLPDLSIAMMEELDELGIYQSTAG